VLEAGLVLDQNAVGPLQHARVGVVVAVAGRPARAPVRRGESYLCVFGVFV
jgi:hypothetical protein